MHGVVCTLYHMAEICSMLYESVCVYLCCIHVFVCVHTCMCVCCVHCVRTRAQYLNIMLVLIPVIHIGVTYFGVPVVVDATRY